MLFSSSENVWRQKQQTMHPTTYMAVYSLCNSVIGISRQEKWGKPIINSGGLLDICVSRIDLIFILQDRSCYVNTVRIKDADAPVRPVYLLNIYLLMRCCCRAAILICLTGQLSMVSMATSSNIGQFRVYYIRNDGKSYSEFLVNVRSSAL